MKRCVCLVLFIIVSLTGCKDDISSWDMAVCGSYAVPGMFCYELKGGTYTATVIEEDSQGRFLFSYTTKSLITEEEETAIVICQVADSKYVYFYEDICYLLGEYTDDDIKKLKEQNDWDNEIDYGKMSKREKKVSFDHFLITSGELDFRSLRRVCSEEFEVEESQILSLETLDKNAEGIELRLLTLKQDDAVEMYYVVANQDYEIAYMPVEDGHADAAVLASFKKENGWYDEDE